MMNSFKIGLIALSFVGCGFTFAADNNDIVGQWRTIDDKTGFSKAIVEISKDSNGIYSGKIIAIIPRPGYTPKTLCHKCPAPFTNQPILGLQLLNDMRLSKTPNKYEGGWLIDPLSGKIYKGTLKLNETGTRITMRGYIGIEILGRSQTWVRQ